MSVRSLKQRCREGRAPQEGSQGTGSRPLFQLLGVLVIPRAPWLAGRHSRVCLCLHMASLCVSISASKCPLLPVNSHGCESWTVKKAESQRMDAFKLWCWRRLLSVPWTARRSNQSILKEISPEYSLQGLMLKLKLQYFGHLMQRANSLKKTLMLGKIEGRRRKG